MLILGLGFVTDAIRILMAWLCSFIYKLVASFFELFINISKVELLSSDEIKPIYQRVTLALTVIMVFYVIFELVKYILEPDTFSDKEKGASKVVVRMIIVVVLIAFVPTIFTYAFKLQNSLIEKEVLSKVILGKSHTDAKSFGNNFAADVLSLFYRYDKEFWDNEDKDCDGVSCELVVIGNIDSLRTNGKIDNLSFGITESDTAKPQNGISSEYALISFDGLFAVIVGGFLVYVLVLYCIDLGVRVAQLAFLQIIAPIPIIGYLSPKKDNIFTKWVKQCITTFLDLFLRLAIIYFVLLVCEILARAYNNGTLLRNVSDDSSTLLYIALILGLLLFAQKAPKMLQELFPKMGAAAGNLGLKKADRVAPLAARAIGAGIGAKRLLGGAISRGMNAHRRNKALEELTGKNKKQRKEEAKEARKGRHDARETYKTARKALREANKLRTDKGTDAEKSAALKAQDDARKEFQRARDEKNLKESAFAEAANRKNQSIWRNATAGAASGAWTGMRTGFQATKLEDIGKKVREGTAKDKQKVASREQWLDSGGYSTAARMASGVAQRTGIRTNAEILESEGKKIESQVKSRERANEGEQAVVKAHSAIESNDISKLENGKLQTTANADTAIDFKNIDDNDVDKAARALIGAPQVGTLTDAQQTQYNAMRSQLDKTLHISSGDSYSAIYSRVNSDFETISAKLKQDPNNDGLQAAYRIAEIKKRQIGKMLSEQLQTRYLKDIADFEAGVSGAKDPRTNADYDQGSISETYNMLSAIRNARTNPRTVEAMEKLQRNGAITEDELNAFKGVDAAGNPVYIKDQTTYDHIEKALKTATSIRQQEISNFKNSQQIIANSDALAAGKADDTASKPSGK